MSISDGEIRIRRARREEGGAGRRPFGPDVNGGHANSFGNTTQSLASRSGIDASPVATCTPWVTRYRPAGRDGHWNQLGGSWIRCESTPVTKHTVNVTPSATPRMAALRSSCSLLVKTLGVVCSITAKGSEPSAARGPDVLDAQPGRGGRSRQLLGADGAPREPRALDAIDVEAHDLNPRARPGRIELDEHRAARLEQRGHPREQRLGMSADAEVAVEEEGGRPPPRPGNAIEHRPSEHRRAAPAGDVQSGGGD